MSGAGQGTEDSGRGTQVLLSWLTYVPHIEREPEEWKVTTQPDKTNLTSTPPSLTSSPIHFLAIDPIFRPDHFEASFLWRVFARLVTNVFQVKKL